MDKVKPTKAYSNTPGCKRTMEGFAQPRPDGRFNASALIAEERGDVKTETRLDLGSFGPFDTMNEAAGFGLESAVQWDRDFPP